MITSQKTRVLILGGGFGGLYAALHLDKTIAAESNVEVTLVSPCDKPRMERRTSWL